MTETIAHSQPKQFPSGTCRACMLFDDSSRMIFLFESNNNLAEIFSKCTSLEASDVDDGLPKHICLSCHNDLVNVNKFRLLCTSSDTFFRQNMKIKVDHDDHDSDEVDVNFVTEEGDKNDKQEGTGNIVEKAEDLDDWSQSDSENSLTIEESRDEQTALGADINAENSDTNGTTEIETSKDGLDVSAESPNKKSTLSCDQCGKKFFKLHRLEGHLRQHQGLKPCVCGICGKAFSKWSGLSLHMSGWHNDKPDQKQFSCDAENCDKAYNMKQSLSLHKKNRHSDTKTVQEIKCVCEVCGKPFKTSNALKKHTYTHTGYDKMPYSCSVCPKKYTTKHKLKEHTMRHDGVKNHICPFCGLRKTTPHELKVHINYHTREKLWPCKLCNAQFSSIGNMSRHFKIVHCGIKAYTCTICDRSFGKSETLKHHVYTHTGEKPHACSICNKRFIQSIALQTHMKTHKKVT
ncbi:zinc finger protein 260-like [Bradysia coprophila]|uniref:zinc finger protein 260-like n=1 Tax=Bradysia coprophila TaxID=38358 RepID=UPI00187D80D0|nr:zinc finger protein 260-like [Bradysia coprophila]